MSTERPPTQNPFSPRPATVLNVLLLLAALVAFVLLAARSPASPGVEVLRGDPPPGVDEVRVHVTGAVVSPGVVVAQPGDRVQDVLALAGGTLPEADLAGVNLALRVQDQDAIHVPGPGEAVALTLLDINRATQRDLEALPQIGPVRATAIIDGRPYASTDELLERSVIPAGVYEQIRSLITAR